MELNRRGRSSIAELAEAAQLDRTTVYRLLSTLEHEGFVARSISDGFYSLSPMVRSLSDGLKRESETLIVSQELAEIHETILWPIDFMTFEAGDMVIRETTHPYSPYSIHRAMVGRSRPLLFSAGGRAMLAASTSQERRTMIEIARGFGKVSGTEQQLEQMIDHLVMDYNDRGYAWSVGGTEQNISGIALPLLVGRHIFGTITLVFFRSAMTVETAAQRYLKELQSTAVLIVARLSKVPRG